MTEINDQFASLAAWTLIEAGDIVVSGNQVFGVSPEKSWKGATRPFTPGTGDFRIVGTINFKTGGSGNETFIGVSSSESAETFSEWKVIGVNGAGHVQFNGGTILTGLTEGTYRVVIAGDANGVSFTITKSDRSIEARAHMTRAEVGTIKTLLIWNGDTRGAVTGTGIGPVGALTELNTMATRTGVEGIGVSSSFNTLDSSARKIRLELPAGLDTRAKPVAVIYFAHGIEEGALENTPIENSDRVAFFKVLLEAGYVVVSSSLSGESVFGNEEAVASMAAMREYVLAKFPALDKAPRIAMGFSGGAAAVCAAVERNPTLWNVLFTISGFVNLQKAREEAELEGTESARTIAFRTAYGVTAKMANYVEKVPAKKLDPCALAASEYNGVPTIIFSSPEDTTMVKAKQSDVLNALLVGHQRYLDEIATSGTHATPGNFPGSTAITVLAEALAVAPLLPPLPPFVAKRQALFRSMYR